MRSARGTVKRSLLLDRSEREGWYGEINSRRYAGWPEDKSLVSQSGDFEVNPGADWQPVKQVHEVLNRMSDCCKMRRAAVF